MPFQSGFCAYAGATYSKMPGDVYDSVHGIVTSYTPPATAANGASHEMRGAKRPPKRRRPDRVQSDRTAQNEHSMSFEAVQWSVRSHGQKQQLAMCFDPGESTSLIHTDHAMDLMWGLLHLRGWKDDTPAVKLGLADGWDDRWWTRAVGPNAFVVEAGLAASSMATDTAPFDG